MDLENLKRQIEAAMKGALNGKEQREPNAVDYTPEQQDRINALKAEKAADATTLADFALSMSKDPVSRQVESMLEYRRGFEVCTHADYYHYLPYPDTEYTTVSAPGGFKELMLEVARIKEAQTICEIAALELEKRLGVLQTQVQGIGSYTVGGQEIEQYSVHLDALIVKN